MSGDFQAVDLLGDPIPANHAGRGRPPHIPTTRNRNKVRLLLAMGWLDGRIASALRITKATLKKHYFVDLRHRDEARDALEGERLQLLFEAAKKGNVGAMRELGRVLEKLDLANWHPGREAAAGAADQQPGAAKSKPLGKKEQAELDAETAHEGTSWAQHLPH